MATEITTIKTAIYETTGKPGPRVQQEIAVFEILGKRCAVRNSLDGDLMLLRIGQRDFALSVLDLAANAALAVEAHLKSEIMARLRGGDDPAPVPPVQEIPIRGAVGANGRITFGSPLRG